MFFEVAVTALILDLIFLVNLALYSNTVLSHLSPLFASRYLWLSSTYTFFFSTVSITGSPFSIRFSICKFRAFVVMESISSTVCEERWLGKQCENGYDFLFNGDSFGYRLPVCLNITSNPSQVCDSFRARVVLTSIRKLAVN